MYTVLTSPLRRLAVFALLPGLTACPLILEGEHNARVDADQDGYLAVGYNEGDDCDDANAEVNPGNTEVCGDGLDNDCSGGSNNCGLSGTLSINDADHLIAPNERSQKVGYGVANVGDVDGNGSEDLLVGAPGLDQSFPQTGGAFLFLGPPGNARTLSIDQADLKVYGHNEDEQIGIILARGGDLDDDGYGDMLLGAPYLKSGSAEKAGAWYAVLGPGGPAMSTSAAYASERGEAANDRLGLSVTSGDMNNSGGLDVAAGAPFVNEEGGDNGNVYVHYGPVQGSQSPSRADVTLLGKEGDQAGYAVLSRDFDGDGIDDLLVGAPGYDGDGADAGTAYMLAGPLAGDGQLANIHDAQLTGITAGDAAGTHLASGDLDGDGYEDALVSALLAEGVAEDAGAVYVMFGPLQGSMTSTAGVSGQSEGDSAGSSVAVGDADGDGTQDLLVGASTRDVSATDSGASYLLYGPVDANIALGRATVKIAGAATEDFIGLSLTLADWDENGSADIVLGALGQDQDGSVNNGGLVYIFMVAGL